MALGIDGRQVLFAFLQADYHATVEAADAALLQCLANKGTVGADDELAQLHLASLQVLFLAKHFRLQGLAEFSKLVVAADDLQMVARKDDIVAVGDVQPVAAAQDAADVDSVFAA